MKRHFTSGNGFTVIEVMLFLAVTGALTVGILAASSVAINSQRYRDAQNTLQSTIQQQYNQTAYVTNDRDGEQQSCGESGVDADTETGAQRRGTSQCLVLGRYIGLQESGELRYSNIVGYKAPGASIEEELTANGAETETEALEQYDLYLDQSVLEQGEVAWGGSLEFKNTTNNALNLSQTDELAIAILRSPLSGVTRTYIYRAPQNSNTVDVSKFTDETAQQAYKLCVEPGSFSLSPRLGVLIRSNASSAGAIELLTEDDAC